MAGVDSPAGLAAAEPATTLIGCTPHRVSLEDLKKLERGRSSSLAEQRSLLSVAGGEALPPGATTPDSARGESAALPSKEEPTAAARAFSAARGKRPSFAVGIPKRPSRETQAAGAPATAVAAAAASRGAAKTAIVPCQQISVTWKDITYDAHVPRRVSGGAGMQLLATAVNIVDRITGRGPVLRILHGSSGEVYPGDLLAMLGASGAGKSTLLGVLSRRLQTNGGEVCYGNVSADAEMARRVTCFIQQEDFFNGFLTVREQLDSTMQLRTNTNNTERPEKLQSLMRAFGLSKVANECIGNLQMGASRGISGGEKKRLSIATGILSQPSIIFADEPTTGLDALTAESVMHVFQLLAQNGRSIVCTIQQPSTHVFAMFNKVLLLSEGRQVYFGERLAMVPYLSRIGKHLPSYTNPADFVIDMLLRPETKDDTEGPTTGDEAQTAAAQALAQKWRQYRVLLRRCGWSNKRNPRVLQARLGQTVVSALLLGFIYLRLPPDVPVSRNGAANLININQGMTGIVSVLQTFTVDKAVALREYQGGAYSLVPYFLAKTTADFSFHVINPILFTTIVWFMMGLNNNVLRWLWALAFVFMQTNVCFSLGYLISSMAPSLDVALACMPLVTMPLVLISGFLIILDTLPRFWVWLPMDMVWAHACDVGYALLLRQLNSRFDAAEIYTMLQFPGKPPQHHWHHQQPHLHKRLPQLQGVHLPQCPPQLQPPACYNSGEAVLQYYCIDEDRMWLNFTILCIQFLVYRLMSVAALVFCSGRR